MKPSALLAFALILAACGTARPVLESDSTRVEVKTVVRKSSTQPTWSCR